MREYIFSIIGASVITAVITLFLPEGGDVSKHVKLLASLAVLCMIAAPVTELSGLWDIGGFFDSLTNVETGDSEAENKYYDVLTEMGSAELEKKLSELVCEKFSIDTKDIKIDVEASEREGVFCVDRVAVGLFGAAVLKSPYEIEEYISSLVGCDCDTYY